jgi:hypothetical protein
VCDTYNTLARSATLDDCVSLTDNETTDCELVGTGTRGKSSDRGIPSIGAPESLRGSGPGARRDRLRRAARRALDREHAGLQDRAPEGCHLMQLARHRWTLKAGMSVPSAAGAECAPTPTWPEGLRSAGGARRLTAQGPRPGGGRFEAVLWWRARCVALPCSAASSGPARSARP